MHEAVENVYLSPTIEALMNSVHQQTGLPPNAIFPIKSYSSEREPTLAPAILIIDALT